MGGKKQSSRLFEVHRGFVVTFGAVCHSNLCPWNGLPPCCWATRRKTLHEMRTGNQLKFYSCGMSEGKSLLGCAFTSTTVCRHYRRLPSSRGRNSWHKRRDCHCHPRSRSGFYDVRVRGAISPHNSSRTDESEERSYHSHLTSSDLIATDLNSSGWSALWLVADKTEVGRATWSEPVRRGCD